MPLISRSSSSSNDSSESGGDRPQATARTLRPRSSDGSNSAVLLDESPIQRDDFTSSTISTPRKRRTISDDASSLKLNNITHPGPNDFKIGRGGGTNAHIGNKKYRHITQSLKSKYLYASRSSGSNESSKSAIAGDIVALWRQMNPPGRFLKQNEQEGGTWYDVGDDQAKKKTSQTIRDGENSSSAADCIKLFGRKEAELMNVCIEYLQKKTPGSGEVLAPSVLFSQKRSRKKMKQQLSSPLALQQLRASIATPSYPIQSVRGNLKTSPSSIAHRLPSELDVVQPQHLHMPMPSNNRGAFKPQPKKQSSLTPKVVGEIFASLSSNNVGCKHDFSIVILPEMMETTIMPPFLQYEGKMLFVFEKRAFSTSFVSMNFGYPHMLFVLLFYLTYRRNIFISSSSCGNPFRSIQSETNRA